MAKFIDNLGLSQLWEGVVTGIWWAEFSDAVKHSIMYESPLIQRNYLAPNISSAKVENLTLEKRV